MSNSDMMMVNPSEIVIDMPVDEQNVLQKMESMKERGIIQPVTLWLQGMRVIDGFHRAVAAQRLGWKEMPCYVVDCSEDAFWDARIQSAKQHHSISDIRLAVWIHDSWKSSEWYIAAQSNDDNGTYGLMPKKNRLADEMMPLIRSLWEVYRKKTGGDPRGHIELDGISGWLNHKAKIWGVEHYIIAEILLDKMGVTRRWDDAGYIAIDELSRKFDLSFDQRQMIARETGFANIPKRYGNGWDYDEVEEWVKEEFDKDSSDVLPLSKFVEAKVKNEAEKKKADAAAREQFYQSPQGQAETHKRKLQTVRESADRAVFAIQSVEHMITDSKDFSDPIAEAIATLTKFHNDHFTKANTRLSSRLSSNNAKLRGQVKQLEQEVASLRRALDAKIAVPPSKLKDVVIQYGE